MTQLESAVHLCALLYTELKQNDIFPALTGGVLYKNGTRKDIDIIMYRGESGQTLNVHDVHDVLQKLEIEVLGNFNRVAKCKWGAWNLDIIFPEAEGEYNNEPIDEKTPPCNKPDLFNLAL